jgi:hypothetical protein
MKYGKYDNGILIAREQYPPDAEKENIILRRYGFDTEKYFLSWHGKVDDVNIYANEL